MGEAIENLLALSGMTRVEGYTRKSKSGKTVHVDSYTRSPGKMSNLDIYNELVELDHKSSTYQGSAKSKNREAQLMTEVRKRLGSGAGYGQMKTSTKGEPEGVKKAPDAKTALKAGDAVSNPSWGNGTIAYASDNGLTVLLEDGTQIHANKFSMDNWTKAEPHVDQKTPKAKTSGLSMKEWIKADDERKAAELAASPEGQKAAEKSDSEIADRVDLMLADWGSGRSKQGKADYSEAVKRSGAKDDKDPKFRAWLDANAPEDEEPAEEPARRWYTKQEKTGNKALDAFYDAAGRQKVDDYGRTSAKAMSDEDLSEAINALQKRVDEKNYGVSGIQDLKVLKAELATRKNGPKIEGLKKKSSLRDTLSQGEVSNADYKKWLKQNGG